MIKHIVNLIIEAETPHLPNLDTMQLDTFIKHIMKRTWQHWMGGTEDEQFKAAVALVLLNLEEGTPDYERVLAEIYNLNQLNAILNTAQAGLIINQRDLENLIENVKRVEPIGLIKLWVEVINEGDL